MLRLALRNLARSRPGSTLVGLVLGVAVFAFFLALGDGLREVIQGEVFPIERLDVVPQKGFSLRILSPGKPPVIPEKKVGRVRAIPGVESVYPRMRLAFPAKAWGGEKVFGQTMWTEIVADGIPANLVEQDLTLFRDRSGEDSRAPCMEDPDCPEDEYCGHGGECVHPVPFLVSRYLIELYNGSVTAAHGLPRIPDWAFERGRGMRVNMDLGKSTLGKASRGEPRKVQIAFAGVSERAIDIGISLPLSYVSRWNEEFAGPEASSGYSSLTVVVADRREVTPVAVELARMGLAVQSKGAEQVGLMITLFEATFVALAFLILVISSLNISHAFFLIVSRRRREIGIMRAVGASRLHILGSFLAEGTIIGIAGSVLGLVLAVALSIAGNVLAARHIPDFPFKPDDFFSFSPSLVGLSLVVGLVSCLAGVILPAIRASRQDPTGSLE